MFTLADSIKNWFANVFHGIPFIVAETIQRFANIWWLQQVETTGRQNIFLNVLIAAYRHENVHVRPVAAINSKLAQFYRRII